MQSLKNIQGFIIELNYLIIILLLNSFNILQLLISVNKKNIWKCAALSKQEKYQKYLILNVYLMSLGAYWSQRSGHYKLLYGNMNRIELYLFL